MPKHRSREELEAGLDEILGAPKDHGRLEAIVVRPRANERVSVESAELSAGQGLEGDHWANGCWMSLPDGSPHPDVQICIMSARAIRQIAGDKADWPPAGDQLFIDMDMSRSNLTVGQRMQLGDTILEITEVPHNGCNKFSERFGIEATRFVNSRIGKENRLRGIYAKVIEPGTVKVGDSFDKIED